MAKNISEPLQNAREMISTVQRNMVETQVPGSKALDASMNINPVGSGGAFSTNVVTTRREDPYKTQVLFSSITSATNGETTSTSLGNLQQVIGNSSDPKKSLLFQAVTNFISQAKLLTGTGDTSTKRSFVDKGIQLSTAINDGINRVNDLRKEADNDLVNGVQSLNDTIRQLNVLNQTILASRAPQTLYNKRDSLIQKICEKLDVQVSFGRNGVAVLTTKGSGYELVSDTRRGEFTYRGATTDDIFFGQNIPDLVFTGYGTNNQIVQQPVVMVGGSSNPNVRIITGGQFQALTELRDIHLPQAGEAFQSLASGVAQAVNSIHNNGTTWPPKTTLTGTTLVSNQQELDLQGPVSFFAVDNLGNQLKNGAGNINPSVIDFTTLIGTGLGQKVTVGDLITEINQKLNLSPSRQRVAMGGILDGNGNQIDGQYLLNNMQLAGTSGVDGNGNWTFDLDLQGNSFFGSNVQILSVSSQQTDGVGTNVGGVTQLAPGLLPPAFRLDVNTDTRTNQQMTLGGFNLLPTAVNVNVTMQVMVTGDNGMINQGTVTFQVNPQTAGLNQRFAYNNNPNVPQVPSTGNFVTAGLTSGPGLAKAMLVDSNGIEINPTDTVTPGNLVIKTNNSTFGISVQGGNLSSFFGLNNFFETDKTTGEINVKDTIVNDPSQISSGQVAKTPGVSTPVTVGDAVATGTMAFVVGGGDFVANDTVTINGQTFIFGPGVGQVALGGNLANSLTNLVNHINTSQSLPGFTVTSNGVDTLTITARNGGTWGNVAVASNLNTGGDTVSINGGVPAQASAGALAGGTNKQSTIQLASYTIGSSSTEVSQALQNLTSTSMSFTGFGVAAGTYLMTLENFTTSVTARITEQYNQAKSSGDVTEAALDALYKENTELFGPKQDEQWFTAMELVNYMKSLANLGRMVNNVENRVLDILFAN